jgi:hypothetical protein
VSTRKNKPTSKRPKQGQRRREVHERRVELDVARLAVNFSWRDGYASGIEAALNNLGDGATPDDVEIIARHWREGIRRMAAEHGGDPREIVEAA